MISQRIDQDFFADRIHPIFTLFLWDLMKSDSEHNQRRESDLKNCRQSLLSE